MWLCKLRASARTHGLRRSGRRVATCSKGPPRTLQGKLVKDIDKLTSALGEVKTMFEAGLELQQLYWKNQRAGDSWSRYHGDVKSQRSFFMLSLGSTLYV